jgi:hypothetical protein
MANTQPDSTQTRRANESTQTHSLFGDIPETLNGWHQEPADEKVEVEYWKRGSTHTQGTHETLYVRRLHDDETLRLVQAAFDQFGHCLTTRHHVERRDEYADIVWQQASRRMEKYPGKEGYSGPPSFPARVGQWTAVTRHRYNQASKTRWVFDPDQSLPVPEDWTDVDPDPEMAQYAAHIALRDSGVESGGYCKAGTQHFDIEYHDNVGTETLATDVPRTGAFEFVEHVMQSLSRPVQELDDNRASLESVRGIGPAKSRKFLLLGVKTPGSIRHHINSESSIANHHHRDRVDALLTESIRADV